MNLNLSGDRGTSTLSQSEKYKICRQIRQQQVENYLQFIAREEKENESDTKGNNKNKKHGDKENKKKEKVAKKDKKKERKKEVTFSSELRLQSHVEDLDEKEVLKALKTQTNFNFSTGNGTSLLHKACIQESAPMVELLLHGGANVNCYDDDWWTPLHIACYQDSKEVVQILLKNGADTTLLDVDGNFALDLCVQGTDTWELMIQYMEEQGLAEEKMKQIRGGQCKLMETDIKSSVLLASDLDRPLYDGITLLHIASANGFYRVTKYLLRKGANASPVDDSGMTPLHCAAKFNQMKTTELLIKHGADIGAKDFSGNRVIDLASTSDIQKLLLSSGAQQRRTVTPQVFNDGDGNDDDEDVDDGRPEELGSVTSKMIYSPGTPMSKADQLTEAKALRYSSNDDGDGAGGNAYETIDDSYLVPFKERGGHDVVSGKDGQDDDDYKDDEDIYYSSIWKTEMAEKIQLPDKSPSDDLSQLAMMDETAVMKTLVERYKSGTIYTNIGEILIAMNPFTSMPIYGKNVSVKYHQSSQPLIEMTPHIYTLGESVLRHSLTTGIPQCCVIGGESGAGKTESCKHLVQYILWMAGSTETDLTLKLAQVNLVLEAFGNAKTVMNSNSSRFAKYLTLHLSNSGKVVGGKIKEFLLEKSRVVRQGEGEANFHIFEWMLAGLTPEEAKQFHLDGQHSFRYLKQSQAMPPTESDTNVKAKFWEVKDCLKFIGFSPEDVRSTLTTLSAILHLGNIEFEADRKNEDVAVITNLTTTQRVAELLRVPEEDFVPALLEDIFVTRGEQTKKPLTPTQARDSVDALAKALYSRLFSWLVNGLNQMVQSPELQEAQLKSIGILDLFGFENLNKNKFEQMCINVANEKLQSFYNNQVFEIEMRDCISEGLPYVEVVLPGNQDVISLFMTKNTGIFDLLDEESRFPKATDDSLATKIRTVVGKTNTNVYKTSRYGGASFTVVHYAGVINYDLAGVLHTNRDALRPALSFVMRSSNSLVVKDLFQSNLSHTGSLNPSKRQRVSRHMKGAKSPFDFFKKLKMSKKENARKKETKKGDATLKRTGNTLTCHFKNSLQELMSHVEASTCHFVRCVKPNKERQPMKASNDYIQGQLYYTGVLETVKIRRNGYSLRATFSHFLKLYPTLTFMASSKARFVEAVDHVTLCNKVLETYKISNFMVGRTKLFVKQNEVNKLEELERQTMNKIVLAQKVVRQFLAKSRLARLRLEAKRCAEELVSMSNLMRERQEGVLKQLENFNSVQTQLTHDEESIREQNEYLDILDNVLEEYSDASELGMSRAPQLVFDRQHSSLATHALPEETIVDDTSSRSQKFEEDKRSSLPSYPAPPPPISAVSSTTTSDTGKSINQLRDKFLHNIPPPPTTPPPRRPQKPVGEINVENQEGVSGREELLPLADKFAFDPSNPQDEENMDPSRQFPLSPKEMYMYQGHYGGEPLMSPSKKQPPPHLPERRPDTQLGNRKSRTSSMSSRSSSSSDFHYDTIDHTNPGGAQIQNNNHNPQHQQHAHHHHPHLTQQQQQQQQLLTIQIQQQLQRQHSLNKGSCAEANNNSRPASYASGASSNPPHSPSALAVDMRPKHQRDASPYGARSGVKSDGAALHNHHHHHHHQQQQQQQQYQYNDQRQFVFTEEAIRHHDKTTSNHHSHQQPTRGPNSPNAHGNGRSGDVNMRNSSDGIYGEFVRPPSSSGTGRPSLTYVPPPVVPTLPPQQNNSNGTQKPSSPRSTMIQQYMHENANQQQIQQQLQLQLEQQHYAQHMTNKTFPTGHVPQNVNMNGQSHAMINNNNNNNKLNGIQNPMHPSLSPLSIPQHQQHAPSSHSPSSSTSSPRPMRGNNSIYGPPSFPAPPPPVPVQDRYVYTVDQQRPARSPSPPPPPPPQSGTSSSHAQNKPPPHHHHPHHHHHHVQHPPKAPPSHTPPPPPGPPPMANNNRNNVQRQNNLNPAGTRSPRNASPHRQPHQQKHHPQNQHKQQVAATTDELAQIKLRNVGDIHQNKSPSSPTTNDSSTGLINFKLKSTPGNVNIYAQGDTTSVLPPPLDDLDDLPPPPPPPELCPPSPPPPPPPSAMPFDPYTNPAHNTNHAPIHATPAPSSVPTTVYTPSTAHAHPSQNQSYSSSSPSSYLDQNQTHTNVISNTPSSVGAGNSYLHNHHHQHQHRQPQQNELAPATLTTHPPPPPAPSPPPPPPPATNTSSSTQQQCFNQQPQNQHPHTPSDNRDNTNQPPSAQEGVNLLDKEKIIADSLAAMDWIPDDIDLSQCPGLVEITKSTPNWKREMIEKKNQEKIEEFVKQIMVKREQEAKWKNIPAWKRRLLEQKDKEDAPPDTNNSAPNKKATKAAKPLPEEEMKTKGDIVPAALSIDPEELAAMPPWKRELLFKRDKVPITFSNEFNPDEEEENGGEEGVSES